MRSGKFRAYYVLIQDLIFSKHTFYMFFALTSFLSYCMATLQKCFDNNFAYRRGKIFRVVISRRSGFCCAPE